MSVESTLVGRSSRSISKPSSIFSKICKIRRRLNISETCETSLYNSLDGRCSTYRRKYYKSAEVRLDSLDKGSNLTDSTRSYAKSQGLNGDQADYIISKKLGGFGMPLNVIPLNKRLDTTAWRSDEDIVYAHVKRGGDRYAVLMYAFDYDYKEDSQLYRPKTIYYHFKLFDGGETIVQIIEGIFQNTNP